MKTAPRIFCVPATESPVLAVLRRGPSSWCHVGRWNVQEWTYEPGAWFRGRLFPQKCDVSPDGRWLAYSAHKASAQWPAGTIYEAISRLPWLHALAAWEAGSTYTRGIRFDSDSTRSDLGSPDVGDAEPCLRRYGLRANRAHQFAVERRRGWVETEDSPPPDPHDLWDEKRRVRMSKSQPSGTAVLEVEGSYAAFRDNPQVRDPASYSVVENGNITQLEGVQWADWASSGVLLVATLEGCLEAHEWSDGTKRKIFERDLASLLPVPGSAPEWALEW
ncbi:MAG: hypothetical protein P8170_08680 [Gemmatimonadota bacterium]|jgi:hypothetical protein